MIESPTSDIVVTREWIRIKEAQTFCGMSKAALYALMEKGLIKNTSLKERNQVKGTRLINFDSLRNFIESRSTGGAPSEVAITGNGGAE